LTKAGHKVADQATDALAKINFGLPIPKELAIEVVELLRLVRREIGDIPPAAPD
jgi:hypothetical protein